MDRRRYLILLLAGTVMSNTGCGILWGCKHAEVTAVSLNPCDLTKHGFPEAGIPFYLPKPLLIISKNFRNVEEAKVGLTDSAPIPNYLDDQAKYADVNARTSWTPVHTTASGQAAAGTSGAQTFPSGTSGGLATSSKPNVFAGGAPISPNSVPPDGLTPETFFTYQIVFVPDMTQKYGLRIKGGPGEMRAAMNMVNGWMFTGLGPFYVKDSSTAQNVLANGIASNLTLGGTADVINSIQNLRAAASGKGGNTGDLDGQGVTVTQIKEVNEKIIDKGFNQNSLLKIPQYAEIYVYEPYLDENGRMQWRQLAEHCFDRHFLGTIQTKVERTTTGQTTPQMPPPKKPGESTGALDTKGENTGTAITPASGVVPTQVNVNCGTGGPCAGPCVPAARKGPVVRLWDACKPKRGTVQTTLADGELSQAQLDNVINANVSQPTLTVSRAAPIPGAAATPPPTVVSGLPGGVVVPRPK